MKKARKAPAKKKAKAILPAAVRKLIETTARDEYRKGYAHASALEWKKVQAFKLGKVNDLLQSVDYSIAVLRVLRTAAAGLSPSVNKKKEAELAALENTYADHEATRAAAQRLSLLAYNPQVRVKK